MYVCMYICMYVDMYVTKNDGKIAYQVMKLKCSILSICYEHEVDCFCVLIYQLVTLAHVQSCDHVSQGYKGNFEALILISSSL